MPEKLVIATCPAYPASTEDDRPLLRNLAAAGVEVDLIPWQADVDWSRYRAVLLRAVWDYFQHATEFRAWLERLDRQGVPCWNPTPLVRWNFDKRYLVELAARGIATVPTLWIGPADGLSPAAVSARIRETGWTDLILKPTVSAGAWRTLRLRPEELAGREDYVREVLTESHLMVQPFLPEVLDHGEYSLLFFDGEFSHAVLKRARPGDFRVQWTHGGTHVAVTPDPSLVAQAQAVLEAAPSPGLYARVDGIVQDGRLVLMELEQIEPHLFFEQGAGSAERFVDALRRRL